MTFEELTALASEIGFSHTAALNPATLEFKQEVRDMCQNGCKMYGKRWSCPPGCGTLDDSVKKAAGFKRGILVQTVGELEDELDGEGMMDAQDAHKEHFMKLWDTIQKEFPGSVAMGAGCCNICKTCTYPDAPCRFPDKMVSSMEAYGLVVMQACKANNLPYYYGPCTIAYTSCFLLD